MKNQQYVFGLFYLIFNAQIFVAQNYTEDFHLSYTSKITSNGYYSRIEFLDSRSQKEDLGYVYSGPENKKVAVINKKDFNSQLKNLIKKTIDSSNADGELLFQLRKLKFLEKLETASEFGICLFRADLYVKQDSTYKRIGRVDTIIIVEAPDATKPLFESTGNAINNFVLLNLIKDFSNTENYNFNQIIKIDSIEKSKFKLYTANQYTNGVYKTFESFKNQIPDFRILEMVYKKEKLNSIKVLTPKGSKSKINPGDFFAYVQDGKPFISAEYGCYSLEKINNDFYFTGEGKVPKERAVNVNTESEHEKKPAENSSVSGTAFYEIKIDHVDGSLMRIKQKN